MYNYSRTRRVLQFSVCDTMCRRNLLHKGKLSLHSLTGYPTCEQARVYSTKARQNVSSSSDLVIKINVKCLGENISKMHSTSQCVS